MVNQDYIKRVEESPEQESPDQIYNQQMLNSFDDFEGDQSYDPIAREQMLREKKNTSRTMSLGNTASQKKLANRIPMTSSIRLGLE